MSAPVASQEPLGLYVHVPFCTSICNYCNFNRGLFDPELKKRYVGALLEEIRTAGDQAPADTIFFGGGTPSLLEPDEIAGILEACRAAFTLSAAAEVTLEANPETVTEARLAAYLGAGITRVSFGVQSFRDSELQRLGRLHSAARAREAIEMARSAGVENVSLDLMMWLPQQSIADWLVSVDALIEANPDHASLYLLELYPGSPLKEDMARQGWALSDDDVAADMYEEAMTRLEREGYSQYEISNVAKPGRESRHNLKYWHDGEWLGFGCGAHSTRAGRRWKNRSQTGEYIEAIRTGSRLIVDERCLTDEERLEEALFTRIRLVNGIHLEEFRSRYGMDVWATYGSQLQVFVDTGLLIYHDDRLRLTRRGMLLANEVMSVFISQPGTLE